MHKREYTKEDFAWTTWGESDFMQKAQDAVLRASERLENIKDLPKEDLTFDRVVKAFDSAIAEFAETLNKIYLLYSVSPDAQVRAKGKEVVDFLEAKVLEFSYDEDLYKVVQRYATKQEALLPDANKLLEEMLRDYKRLGFDLAKEQRDQLQKNNQKIQELANQFSANLNEWKDFIVLSPSETGGLSESYLSGLKKDESGNFLVTLESPDYVPFVRDSKVAQKRKELMDKYYQRGGQANLDLLAQILKLRAANAEILGYEDHVGFSVETKMAKTKSTVKNFLEGLTESLRPAVVSDLAVAVKLKQAELGDAVTRLEYYDVTYYANELEKQNYGLDGEKIKEYFPLAHVLTRMLELYETLFSVKFNKLSSIPIWHEDVEVYEVRDLDGSIISYFFLDLYPRDGKYGHAAQFSLVVGGERQDGYTTPVSAMVANFPKATPSQPSLLQHAQVQTLFHEFGHVVHENLAHARFFAQSGTHVAKDFVEAPSQMLEGWIWDKEILRGLTSHYLTHEPLSDSKIDQLVRSKQHFLGYDSMRQLVFATFDFRLHTEDHTHDIPGLYAEVNQRMVGVELPAEQKWPAGFGHLVHGYDAGYYGYMWAKVYSADMFSRFKAAGLNNAQVGLEYRTKVLEKGSSRDELESVRDFLGREPDNRAFLAELNLQ